MGPTSLSNRAQEFCAIQTREQLAAWIGISDRRLRFLLYALSTKDRYVSFSIRKKNGGVRSIDAPSKPLKQIQRTLLSAIAEIAPPSGVAKGFVAEKSILDHAWPHRRKRWVVLADLKDFFPSIHFGRVRGAFMARPFQFNSEVATCLAQLCCKDGALPQGAPTSPVISNLICRRFDRALARIAKSERCTVSRYADDICFSTSLKVLPPGIAHQMADGSWLAGPGLVAAVSGEGFALNPSKFKVRSPRARQLVTGLVVNDGVAMPRSWRRQVRTLLHLTKVHGEEKALEIVDGWPMPAMRKPAKSIEQVIRGKVHFAHWLDQASGREFTRSLHRAFPKLRRLMPNLKSAVPLRIMSEGQSDLLHLEAALQHFHSTGEYRDLAPAFRNFRGDGGDAELMETLYRLAKAEVYDLTIGIFDCDREDFMKKHSLSPGAHVRLGERVYAMCLGKPDFVAACVPFCIESLYKRSDATRITPEGRRLFFGDEFDIVSGFSRDGSYWREFPRNRSLVVSDNVTEATTSKSVLLAKSKFAELVHARATPFEKMEFGGFSATFDVIREILNEVEYAAVDRMR